MMPVFLILTVVIAIFAIVFALENTEMVTVTLFTVQYESNLAIVLMLALVLGIIMGVSVVLPRLIKQGIAMNGLQKQIKTLEDKAASAAAPAISDPPEAADPTPPQPNFLK